MKLKITSLFILLASVTLIEAMHMAASKSRLIYIANVDVGYSEFKESKNILNEADWKARCTYKKDGLPDIKKVKMVRQKSMRSGNVDYKIMKSAADINAIVASYEKSHNEALEKNEVTYDKECFRKDKALLEEQAEKFSNLYTSTTEADKRTQIENICDDIFTNLAIMRTSIYMHKWIKKATSLVAAVGGAVVGGVPGAAIGSGVGYLAGRSFIRRNI
ncbi:uncharacterized protein LOC116349307 [Contarinia nasturtii]|uniref:uncharacterized protein LOC116349307 n=1 Tax=Contarinia nasturtii TaxID=265458 RepID=UPI0012D47A05|nr:uncharacterized protein LOC116349307 [Contarinia nasturtii]